MPHLRLAQRRCAFSLLWIAAFSAALFISQPHAAFAQTAVPVAAERLAPISPEKRAELYRELRSQAEFFEKQSAVVKTAAKLIAPTVVHIEADVSRRPALQVGPGRQIEENGSGVTIELAGKHYVLTSGHVIREAQPGAIKINLADGRRLLPEKVWRDDETDVAVMAISGTDLVPAPVGDSDKVETGDFVLAFGNPFGLTHSVTFGIISAKGRRNLELGDSKIRLQDFLQTDAAINPGNSGGPLVSLRGELIGINTCIASSSGGNEGIGFAIPINMFMTVARQLVEQGRAARAFLGVTLDPKFGPTIAAEIGLPRPTGARITGITQNSPAAAARLQEGDVVLQYNNTPVENDAHLTNLVNLTEIGKPVTLIIFRDRQTFKIQATVGDRSKF